MQWNTKPLFVLLLFIYFVRLCVFIFYFVLIFELFNLLLILFFYFIYLFIYFLLHNFLGTLDLFPSLQVKKVLDPRLCYMPPFFSEHETKAQAHYCNHALSVFRPTSLTFHILDFSSETTKHNSTKHDRKQDLIVLYQFCFFFPRADQKKTRWPPWPITNQNEPFL